MTTAGVDVPGNPSTKATHSGDCGEASGVCVMVLWIDVTRWQSGGRDSLCGHERSSEAARKSTTRRDGAVTTEDEKKKELDEAAKKFERTLGSNKPPKEK